MQSLQQLIRRRCFPVSTVWCPERGPRAGRRPHVRRALTMIELLIVVAVMVILIGIALPVMKTGIEGRKLGEAARQVSTGITLAKSLAAEKDRFTAVGIVFESLPEDTTMLFARRLYMA